MTAPDIVVAKQDSLLALSKDKRPEFVAILTTAHINIARRAESKGDISVAIDEYQKVLKIDPYEQALIKKLPDDLRQDAEDSRKIAHKNKTTLNNFWK